MIRGKVGSEAFWSKVDVRAPHECWQWLGSVQWQKNGRKGGYGHSGSRLAHRRAWAIANGPIPDKLCVLHRCDNPGCCNPDHLFLGSLLDNNRDMIAKGRFKHSRHIGTANGRSKLRDHDVLELRRLFSLGMRQYQLAKMFRITRTQVSTIRHRKQWRN